MSFGGLSFTSFGTSADTTAPVLSAATGTQTGTTTANLAVTTDTAAGTMWWVVIPTGNTAPNAAQVRAGTDGSSVAATATNATGGTSVGSTSFTASATGLSAATGYKVYFTQDDLAGNHATAVGSSTFTTASSSVIINHVAKQFTGASSGNTTSSVDTTGATLLVAVVAYDPAATGLSVTDSKSNTWILAPSTLSTVGSGPDAAIYYVNSATPTVGSGHTFTFNATNGFGAIAVAAFSNSVTAPLDQVHIGSNGGGATTVAAGSITPGSNNEVVIAGVAYGGSGGTTNASSINGSFAITDAVALSSQYGVALAWLKQTTATAANPTWTMDSANQFAATIASFKGT